MPHLMQLQLTLLCENHPEMTPEDLQHLADALQHHLRGKHGETCVSLIPLAHHPLENPNGITVTVNGTPEKTQLRSLCVRPAPQGGRMSLSHPFEPTSLIRSLVSQTLVQIPAGSKFLVQTPQYLKP